MKVKRFKNFCDQRISDEYDFFIQDSFIMRMEIDSYFLLLCLKMIAHKFGEYSLPSEAGPRVRFEEVSKAAQGRIPAGCGASEDSANPRVRPWGD